LRRRELSFLPCLVCGVDSGPPLTFFLWLVGAGLAASACVLAWGAVTGKFDDEKGVSRIPLQQEGEEP
jgi:hypothetical protein